MGSPHEQLKSPSGGSYQGRIDLRLNFGIKTHHNEKGTINPYRAFFVLV
jgi:hypothetical protein